MPKSHDLAQYIVSDKLYSRNDGECVTGIFTYEAIPEEDNRAVYFWSTYQNRGVMASRLFYSGRME